MKQLIMFCNNSRSKRAVLHISNECFVPFGVTIGFPNNSLYTAKLNNDLRRMVQSGIVDKIVDEVRWEMQRSSTGKLLSVSDSPIFFLNRYIGSSPILLRHLR